MRPCITPLWAALVLAAVTMILGVAAGPGSAVGLTAADLQAQGWTCVIPNPVTHNFLHCRNPGSEPLLAGPTQLDFVVFDASGTTFLGTEHLVRSDLYHDQPCNGTPTGQYEFVARGPGYYGCHHFVFP